MSVDGIIKKYVNGRPTDFPAAYISNAMNVPASDGFHINRNAFAAAKVPVWRILILLTFEVPMVTALL